ncbi:DUF2207 domain-containing protein [Bacillus sonorensis]|uniref:DUF2207 domain-containing protein n=2 Tax=Bacillus sonorensis TaxID=119858 RepID=M5NZY6_9BACI|nr:MULTISPECIES: DUF2207 domain-containing protein [Bacillus]EME72779.1 hypothetical protein BSONL12_20960 [Bacillus sonorensis L12]MDR4956869.1 DUF2207 domain-containing protein [Bacillus sonorensis]MEC0342492.1 DUF2207 domain-containing protein [Bacillus sonorensis]MEC0426711.1 DUF2207 domain-containing protein [Bacillus sonorensis]MEC0459571.1 DUF2207 domain-containing protein [Bacillus sonorensis]
MKRSFFFLMFIALFLVSGFSEAEKSFSIDKVDIQATVKENGDLDVEEVYTYDFKGSFNGTTRSFSGKTAGSIKDFKAYLSEKRGGGRPLKTKWKDGAYLVYTASKDETKKVRYHYIVEDAAQKFEDTAVLFHSFYEKTNEDFHHMTIQVHLPNSVKPPHDIHAFLHEKGHGKIANIQGRTVTYKSGLYPAGTSSELRIYFPQNALSKAVRHPSIQPVDELLAKEKSEAVRYTKYHERMENTDRLLWISAGLVGLALAITLIVSLAGKKRRKLVPIEKLETFDPVLVAFLYKKGVFRDRDLLAGLLSLYQRGLITMKKVKAEDRFLHDKKAPNETYQFDFSGHKLDLPKPDRLLIEKLFEQTGNDTYSFRLDSLSGPTEEEVRQQKDLEKYERKRIILQNVVQQWTESVKQDPVYKEFFQENRWLKMISLSLLFVHTGLLLNILYTDIAPQAGFMTACIIFGFALSAGIVLAKFKLYSILFFIGLFTVSLFTDNKYTMMYFGGSITLSIMLIAFIPSLKESISASIYRRSILFWRHRLKKGEHPGGSSRFEYEKNMIYAIVLEVEDQFGASVDISANRLDPHASPVLGLAAAGYLYYPFSSWQHTASQANGGTHDAGSSGSDGGSGAGAF